MTSEYVLSTTALAIHAVAYIITAIFAAWWVWLTWPLSRDVCRAARRAWRRRPRLVSLPTYNLARQAPKLMRQLDGARKRMHDLGRRYEAERVHHRRAVAEKKELAAMLEAIDPHLLRRWKSDKRAEWGAQQKPLDRVLAESLERNRPAMEEAARRHLEALDRLTGPPPCANCGGAAAGEHYRAGCAGYIPQARL